MNGTFIKVDIMCKAVRSAGLLKCVSVPVNSKQGGCICQKTHREFVVCTQQSFGNGFESKPQ